MRISWVTLGSDKASTHIFTKRSCLSGDQDLYLSPGWEKLFSFSIMTYVFREQHICVNRKFVQQICITEVFASIHAFLKWEIVKTPSLDGQWALSLEWAPFQHDEQDQIAKENNWPKSQKLQFSHDKKSNLQLLSISNRPISTRQLPLHPCGWSS